LLHLQAKDGPTVLAVAAVGVMVISEVVVALVV
jgi:uncharacterized protein (DUF983 family)